MNILWESSLVVSPTDLSKTFLWPFYGHRNEQYWNDMYRARDEQPKLSLDGSTLPTSREEPISMENHLLDNRTLYTCVEHTRPAITNTTVCHNNLQSCTQNKFRNKDLPVPRVTTLWHIEVKQHLHYCIKLNFTIRDPTHKPCKWGSTVNPRV